MIRNILLSCTLAIGDVVMATSAAALLKKIYPGVRISFMVKQLAEEVVRNNLVIDEVLAPKYQQKKLALRSMSALVRDLRQRQFDLFVSLDGKVRPALLATLAGIPVRVGPSRLFGSNTRMPLLLTKVIEVGDFRSTHYIASLHRLVQEHTGSGLTADPVLPEIAPEDVAVAEKLLSDLGSHRYTIALCVKTNPLKTWPAEHFAELIERLGQKYDAAFWTLGGWYDKDYVADLLTRVGQPVANYCGVTSLHQLIAMLRRSDILITLDTAPMHIASAMHLPQVAIFGSTAPASVAPLSPQATVLTPAGLPCIPCIPNRIQVYPGISKRIAASHCDHKRCMEQISVDMVEEAADRLLQGLKR